MDDETPEMEALTQEMRSVMAAWVADPNNSALKQQYRELQRRYQRLFQAYKSAQRNGVVPT
jgi:GTP cyclohydrolase I